jgi:hypothetical protein
MRKIGQACGAVMVALLLGTVPAAAHHSFAPYDSQRFMTLTGTVTRVEWVNPHAHFYMDVRDPDTGSITNWAWQMNGPTQLMRRGWIKSSMKVGDVVTVDGYGTKNSDASGIAGAVTFMATGQQLSAASSAGLVPIVTNLLKQFGSGRLPNCPNGTALREATDDLQWLRGPLSETGWGAVDPAYEVSLYALSDVTTAAIRASDRNAACAALTVVARDIRAKRVDCRMFGKGRANLNVQVETITEQGPASMWEVYARWLPLGDRFTGVPRRLEGLSTPARGIVPVPGEYELYAHNPTTGVMSEPIRVSIGGKDPFTLQLVVPTRR